MILPTVKILFRSKFADLKLGIKYLRHASALSKLKQTVNN